MKIKVPYLALLVGPWLSTMFGSALNLIVMGLNGAQMPVLMPKGTAIEPEDIFHTVMTSGTHLKFLADWLVIGQGIASIGDMFIWGGEALFYPALLAWVILVIKDSN